MLITLMDELILANRDGDQYNFGRNCHAAETSKD